MKEKPTVSNVPSRLPLTATAFQAFLLHYFKAAEWLWTAWIIFALLIWIIKIIAIYNERHFKAKE